MKSPLISVVIPCYNQSEFLSDCLGSVLSQSFEDWEAIVIDDASTEGNVAEVLRNFPDRRIRLATHEENRGLAAARNTGFTLAHASLVVALDADDMLKRSYLERMGQTLISHPEADCAFGDLELFGANEGIWHYDVWDIEALLERQWIPGAGTLMRRRVWEKVGGYCEAAELRCGNEDWDFWLAAAEQGLRAIHIAEPLYRYRRHLISMATQLQHEDHITRKYIYKRHQQLFDSYNAGRRFIANGYKQAASASWNDRKRFQALRLVLWALLLDKNWQNMATTTRAVITRLRGNHR